MVYILLGKGFEEAEALVTADVLRRADIPVTLTGIGGSTVTGSHNITVLADQLVEQVKLVAGDMVVLPGGMGGVASIEHSQEAMALVRQAASSDEYWLAAICAAPTLLARAGVLPKGVNAVCYPGLEGALVEAGAVPQMDRPAVTEGKLITSRSAGSAYDFGLALAAALAGTALALTLRHQAGLFLLLGATGPLAPQLAEYKKSRRGIRS